MSTLPPPPMPFRWDGANMVPVHPRRAAQAYAVDGVYALVEHKERSRASHDHEFAWLKEAWMNLPEDIADEFPSEVHLRKRALIATGFYDEMLVDAGTNAAALRVAQSFRFLDEFVHVVVRGGIVAVRRAKSQSYRAMDRAEFQRSKDAILDYVASLIGVSGDDLARQGRAA